MLTGPHLPPTRLQGSEFALNEASHDAGTFILHPPPLVIMHERCACDEPFSLKLDKHYPLKQNTAYLKGVVGVYPNANVPTSAQTVETPSMYSDFKHRIFPSPAQ
jgi:hypothetical protein